jgi:hypothetical protein
VGTEPVYILARQAGFRGILPCKGRSPWQQRNASQTVVPLPECNLSYANGIWLADLDADAWKLKVRTAPQPLAPSAARPVTPRDDAGREMAAASEHAGHILSEEWQKQPNGAYPVPGGSRQVLHAPGATTSTRPPTPSPPDLGPGTSARHDRQENRPQVETETRRQEFLDSVIENEDWLNGRSVPVPFSTFDKEIAPCRDQ